MIKMYAGIGARKTPKEILDIMRSTSHFLAYDGFCCNTGAALGADQAFANGAAGAQGGLQLMLPWASYEKDWISSLRTATYRPNIIVLDKHMHTTAFESVKLFHPAPNNLSDVVIKLHARNHMIIEGAKFVVCWTPEGRVTGGTGQALRIAASMGITVYNLGLPATLKAFQEKINDRLADDIPF